MFFPRFHVFIFHPGPPVEQPRMINCRKKKKNDRFPEKSPRFFLEKNKVAREAVSEGGMNANEECHQAGRGISEVRLPSVTSLSSDFHTHTHTFGKAEQATEPKDGHRQARDALYCEKTLAKGFVHNMRPLYTRRFVFFWSR